MHLLIAPFWARPARRCGALPAPPRNPAPFLARLAAGNAAATGATLPWHGAEKAAARNKLRRGTGDTGFSAFQARFCGGYAWE
jgi:hypothetical protein